MPSSSHKTLQKDGHTTKVSGEGFQRKGHACERPVTFSMNSGEKAAGVLWSPRQAALRSLAAR